MGKLAAAIDILISANSARVKTDTDKISAIIGSASNDWKAKVESAGKVMGSAFDKAGLNAGGLASKLGGVGLAMAGLGAGVGVGVLVSKINGAIESAAKLKQMAEMTGASVENLSSLGMIAKVAGTDLDSLTGSMVKLAKNMEASGGPSKDMGAALNRIGLSVKDLKGLDSAEMMKKIADAMGNYADSAGKTAVATTLFGRAGATMLPVLKEMHESGAMVAKTTAAQAEAADVYEKNLKRLTITKESLYKTIGLEIAPAMAIFTSALLEAKKESDGLQKTLKGLASDGALASFAENAASAAAIAIDAFRGVATIVQGTGLAIGATFAAIATRSTEPFKELSADWDKLKKQVNDSSVYKKLEEVRAKGLKLDGKDRPVVGGGNNGTVNDNGAGKEAASFIKSLELRTKKTNEAEYAALRLKAADLGVSDAAEKWINKIENADFGRFVDKFALGLDSANSKVQFQISLIGKTKEEQDKLTASFESQERLQQTRLDLEQKFGKEYAASHWDEVSAKADTALNKQIQLIEQRNAADKDGGAGMEKAFNSYIESAEKTGTAIEGAFGNAFKGIEDGMVSMVSTGTMNFQQFANSILSDMMRIMMRAMVIAPIMRAMGFGGISGGGDTGGTRLDTGGAMSTQQANGGAWSGGVQFYATGGVFNGPTAFSHAGGIGVLGEAGPEAVMPLSRGADGKLGIRASGAGGGNVTVVVNNNADNTQATTKETTDGMGNRQIEIMIASMVNKAISTGKTDNAMKGAYGLRRVAT